MTDIASKQKVRRHTIIVRLIHWTVALSGLLLLFSGMGQKPMYKRYNVVNIPGMSWSDDFELLLVMHLVGAIFFSAAVAFHIIYHIRRREREALPRRGDVGASYRTIVAMLRGRPEPPARKYLPEQRLTYLLMGTTILMLIGTGLVKAYKNLGPIVLDPTFLQVISLIHTFAAMFFMLLVIAHLAAFLIPANRPLLPSMFSGKCCADYARHRHPLWKPETQEGPDDR
ncbi:MAG: cytochrome b/b6 domain-containing protein [Bradymonadaceae bacterium]